MTEKTYDGQHTMREWWQLSMEFEQRALPAFRDFVKPGCMVFDIGSNRGRKTYIFLALGAAKVIAVDPLYTWGNNYVPEFYWKWGKDKRVVPVARAVTDQKAATLHVNRFTPYISSIDIPWMTESAHGIGAGEVYYAPTSLIEMHAQGITLDGLINIYGIPDFLKVDVEGHENTAMLTLSQPVPGLNMEFHEDWIPAEAMAHIDTLAGYEWNYCLNNIGEFVAPEWMDSKAIIDYMHKNLTKKGPGSWGDVYARRIDAD